MVLFLKSFVLLLDNVNASYHTEFHSVSKCHQTPLKRWLKMMQVPTLSISILFVILRNGLCLKIIPQMDYLIIWIYQINRSFSFIGQSILVSPR